MQVAFAVLGTGQHWIHDAFRHLANRYPGRFDVVLEYNEGLAHQLYAGSDFLMMPSRVEPCGLNQMYAMRYGTLPIVRSVGGLKDTVPDIGVPNNEGRGIRFTHFNLDDGHIAIYRAVELFHNRAVFEDIRQRITEIDFSWERSAADYQEVYEQMI
jgi:starch synthase